MRVAAGAAGAGWAIDRLLRVAASVPTGGLMQALMHRLKRALMHSVGLAPTHFEQ